MSAEARATLAPDGAAFTMSDAGWSQTLPIAALPGQVAFYRRLRDRGANAKLGQPGPYAKHYLPILGALEALQGALRTTR